VRSGPGHAARIPGAALTRAGTIVPIAAAILLGACDGGSGEIAPVPVGAATEVGAPGPWFREIAAASGVDFRHESGAAGKLYMPEVMGGGVALLDVEGDGDLDLYFVNQNRALPATAREERGQNRLYLQGPGGRFEDATATSGIGHGGFGMGVAAADVDNDADLDLFLTNYGPAALYLNRGDGTFEDATAASGIAIDGWSTSAAFFDYDRDGLLDLYVARYLVWDPSKQCASASGRPDYCGPTAFPPERDVLLHNEGGGRFRDVSADSGIRSVAAPGLGVVSDDFDDDGWPDVYVANDGFANLLWINRRDGTFTEEAVIRGAGFDLRGLAEAGMGLVAADLDADGSTDLFVTNLDLETNTLYRNLGAGGGFLDVTDAVGLGVASWRRTGFGTVAFDAELDGDLDLYVANGRVTRGEPQPGCELPEPWAAFAEPALFYLNDGRGAFALSCDEAGGLCRSVEVGRGVAAGDVDADGDVDLLVGSIHGAARLYRNDAPRRGRPLVVHAIDPRFRRDAVGARVSVITSVGRQVRTILSGGSYLSSGPAVAHFGLPDGSRLERIEVRWPDGARESFPAEPEGEVRRLVRGEGSR